MQFTEHIAINPDTVNKLVRGTYAEHTSEHKAQNCLFALRQIQEGLRAMGLFLLGLGLGLRAFMGLGISVPYISPPLIHTRLLGRIKELAEPLDLGDCYGLGIVVMAPN